MEIQQLRHLRAAANSASFAQAAKLCFTSRQNIAHSISALERELGAVLFERHGKGARLTPAGQQAACQAEEILNRVDALRGLFAADGAPAGAMLNLAVTHNLLARIPERAQSFIYEFDQPINLFEVGCEECHDLVCAGEADVGLALCMRRSFPDCEAQEVSHLKAYAIVNERSPLAERAQLSVGDLRGQRLQIMSESEFQHEPLFRQLRSLGYDFGRISIATTPSSLYGVKRNEAVGIGTSQFAADLPGGMRALPLDDPQLDWCIYALHPRRSDHRVSIDRFIRGLRQSCSS